MITKLPFYLIISRFIFGIFILLISLFIFNKNIIAIAFSIGFVSDILDGIIARKLNVSNEKLRRLDSNIDTIFYSCSFAGILFHNWEITVPRLIWVFVIIGIKLIRYIYDYIKFKKETSYHMYSAKFWAITLFLFYLDLVYNDRLGLLFWITIIIGILTNIESLLTSVILKKWQHDLSSIFVIYKNRTNEKGFKYKYN